jgi:guanosine-3',5'-bis(diphosphate) 3'-pyrophosphohydrolase
MSYRDLFFSKLKNFKPKEVDIILKAYELAKNAHKGQKRESGREYLAHPVEVAIIVINLGLDAQSVCSALLHDTIEDTKITTQDIKKNFGEEIVYLVNGLTKLGKVEFMTIAERSAENFRKLLMSMSEDIRVLIIKLADRLNNMRTINGLKDKKRRIKISNETLLIFAPLAERIGMYKLKNELESLAFQQTKPEESKAIIENIQKTKKNKKDLIEDIIEELEQEIKIKAGINCLIYGREKKPYSVWEKMKRKNVSFEYLRDIMAFRVIVDEISTCYKILGIINSKYKMVPNTFKDYISTPKANRYQSLHTVVMGPKNIKIEIQIRTKKMHDIAEFGVASHWLYKQNIKEYDKQLKEYRWIKELVTTFEHSKNISKTFNKTKLQLHKNEVFCFTPKGDVFNLPKGSTIIDFAYAVHSDIGNRCIGGKINGIITQIKTELSSGDEVEIITSKNSNPSPSWLVSAKTTKAKSEIKHFLRNQKQKEYEKIGRKIIKNYFEGFALKISDKILEGKLEEFQKTSVEEIYAYVGEGLITQKDFLKQIYPEFVQKQNKEEISKKIEKKILLKTEEKKLTDRKRRNKNNIPIEGLPKGISVKFAKCCFPVRGDDIVGIINTGSGITVHKKNCKNIKHINILDDKYVQLKWNTEDIDTDGKYVSKIIIIIKNVPGSIASIANLFAERSINISGIKTLNKNKDIQEIELEIEIRNLEHLSDVLASARTLKNVYSVDRY